MTYPPAIDLPRRCLSVREAAVYLNAAPQTLYNWRHLGQGPPYVRIGSRVVYRIEDLEAWLEVRLVVPGQVQ